MVSRIDDDFNRANGYLTSPWLQTSGATNTPYISTNEARTPSSNGTYSAIYDAVLDSDDMEVGIIVGTEANGTTNTNMANSILWLGAPNSTTAGSGGTVFDCVALQFRPLTSTSNTSLIIYTIDGSGTATQRAALNGVSGGQFGTGDSLVLRCVGNVYTVYVNGVSKLSWTDSGNAANRDASHRSVGFRTFRTVVSITTYTSTGANSFWAQALRADVSSNDTGSSTDTATLRAYPAGADTATGTDTATKSVQGPGGADDAGTGTDTATGQRISGAVDSGSGTEAVNQLNVSGAVDQGSGLDTGQTRAQATDTSSTANDSASVRAYPAVADAGSSIESAIITNRVVVSDSAALADTSMVRPVATDEGSGQDDVTGFAEDTGSLDDTAIGLRARATDTGTGTDDALASNKAIVTDTGTGTDDAVSRPRASDSSTGVDAGLPSVEVGGLGTAYRTAVLADTPDAYFPMDDARRGQIQDVVTGAVGVMTGTVADRPIPYPGRHAGDFDNAQYFKVDDSAAFVWMGGDYTAEWWAVADTLNNDGVFSQRQSAGVNESVSVFNSTTKFSTDFGSSSGNRQTFANYVIPTGEWNHYVVTLDSATGVRTLYVNGVQADSSSGAATPPAAAPPLWVGVMGNNTGYTYDGGLAHLAFYRKKLSGSQIQSHYLAGAQGVEQVGDSGTFAEQARIQIRYVGDVGSGTDDTRSRARATDSATSVDNAVIAVWVLTSDSASSLDTALVGLPDADLGTIVEFAQRTNSGVLDVPRLVQIEPEPRAFVVEADPRTRTIDGEQRTERIDIDFPARFDSYDIPSRGRTALVKSEVRKHVAGKEY